MEKEMKTIIEMIEKMREKHFIHDFEIENNKLICKDTHESFEPQDLIIEKVYRFEGDSNPDDMSILYAITSGTGTQGILIDAYGTYANPQITEFMKKVSIKEENEKNTNEK